MGNLFHQFIVGLFACLLFFYVLATSMVISGREPIWVSAHSWRLYNAAPLGHQANSAMTLSHTQSHYPYTEPTSPCAILIMPSARLGSDKYHFDKSLV